MQCNTLWRVFCVRSAGPEVGVGVPQVPYGERELGTALLCVAVSRQSLPQALL